MPQRPFDKRASHSYLTLPHLPRQQLVIHHNAIMTETHDMNSPAISDMDITEQLHSVIGFPSDNQAVGTIQFLVSLSAFSIMPHYYHILPQVSISQPPYLTLLYTMTSSIIGDQVIFMKSTLTMLCDNHHSTSPMPPARRLQVERFTIMDQVQVPYVQLRGHST